MNFYSTKSQIGRVMFLLLLFILGWGTLSFAQGIRFQEKSIDELVAEAKSQDKLVFVEIFLTGCSHCEALAPVLDEKKVGDFYNATFVSAKYEANSPLSKALQETKKDRIF